MRLSAKDRKALSSLKAHTSRVLSRPGIANAGRHVALLIIDASGTDSHQTMVADLTLAARFGQPSELASLEAAVAAGSCDRRTAQCNAESAAAAPLSHRQKQAWCAKVAANTRRAKAIKLFNDADGCWPARWHVPNEIRFDNPCSIRVGHMCKVAGVDVEQIDALVEALETWDWQGVAKASSTSKCQARRCGRGSVAPERPTQGSRAGSERRPRGRKDPAQSRKVRCGCGSARAPGSAALTAPGH